MRFRLVRRDAVETIVRRSKVGDWFLLYMLGENLDTVIYRDVMHELANKLASRHHHGVPGVKGELQEAWSRWASPLVLFRARSRGCPLNNLLFMTLAFRNILNSKAKNLVGAYRRSPTWYMRAIRVRVSSTLSGFTPIKLISNRDVVTWYTRYTYSQPCLWRNVNFMQKL